MSKDLNQANGKKSYEPPRLTTISLRPEEAVLVHCKTQTGMGSSFGGCAPSACHATGS
jgi:hypothetical protein